MADLVLIEGVLASPLPEVTGSDPEQLKREEHIRQYIGREVRLTITDGRILEGIFQCVDSKGNIVVEYGAQIKRTADPANAGKFIETKLRIGQFIVADKHIVKFLASKEPPRPPITSFAMPPVDPVSAATAPSAPVSVSGEDSNSSGAVSAPAAPVEDQSAPAAP